MDRFRKRHIHAPIECGFELPHPLFDQVADVEFSNGCTTEEIVAVEPGFGDEPAQLPVDGVEQIGGGVGLHRPCISNFPWLPSLSHALRARVVFPRTL